MTDLAPIALFVHARPGHTQQTLQALAKNDRAAESHLFIHSDGARNEDEELKVAEIRQIIRQNWEFASVTLIERERNYGLAANIRDGVTKLVEKYGRIIVMEDDLVTSPLFLTFMNEALDRYQNSREVWHVNGWTYPVAAQQENSAFFTSIMECWGWGTWRDRWQQLNCDPQAYLGRWTNEQIDRFNIGGGYDSWSDLKRNAAGLMRTWAVFWYATMFDRKGLCLSPPVSFVSNVGIDGSGANSGNYDLYSDTVLSTRMPDIWPDEMRADEAAFDTIRKFLLSRRPPLWRRIASAARWQYKKVRRGSSAPATQPFAESQIS